MHQLPGIGVIRQSYRFLSTEAGTIIRLAWAPLLIVSLVQYFVSRMQLQDAIAAVDSGDILALAMGSAQWQALISGLVGFVGGAIVAVAIHRVILFGDRKPGTVVYFAFGKVEMLFVALPLAVTIVLVLGLAAVLPGFFVPGQSPGLGLLVIGIVILVLVIFVSIRLSLLWPIVVVDERYAFREAWEMSQGNFWRLFGTFVLGVLPFVVVLVVAGILFQGSLMVSSLEELAAALRHALDLLPVQLAINYVLTILISAVAVALLSYSYKALKGYGPDDLVPQ